MCFGKFSRVLHQHSRTDGRPTKYDLFTQPLQWDCLCFSCHICYCLILKEKVAALKIMKSKSNTHSQHAPGKKHKVSILISLTESRNVASVTHHLPSLLSFFRVEKDGGELGVVQAKTGKLMWKLMTWTGGPKDCRALKSYF